MAIRAQAEALRQNPNLIELRKVERWVGSVPQWNGTGPLLNLSGGPLPAQPANQASAIRRTRTGCAAVSASPVLCRLRAPAPAPSRGCGSEAQQAGTPSRTRSACRMRLVIIRP